MFMFQNGCTENMLEQHVSGLYLFTLLKAMLKFLTWFRPTGGGAGCSENATCCSHVRLHR